MASSNPGLTLEDLKPKNKKEIIKAHRRRMKEYNDKISGDSAFRNRSITCFNRSSAQMAVNDFRRLDLIPPDSFIKLSQYSDDCWSF